jgi:hypothetical protein
MIAMLPCPLSRPVSKTASPEFRMKISKKAMKKNEVYWIENLSFHTAWQGEKHGSEMDQGQTTIAHGQC